MKRITLELTRSQADVIIDALYDNTVLSYIDGAKTSEGAFKLRLINKIKTALVTL